MVATFHPWVTKHKRKPLDKKCLQYSQDGMKHVFGNMFSGTYSIQVNSSWGMYTKWVCIDTGCDFSKWNNTYSPLTINNNAYSSWYKLFNVLAAFIYSGFILKFISSRGSNKSSNQPGCGFSHWGPTMVSAKRENTELGEDIHFYPLKCSNKQS